MIWSEVTPTPEAYVALRAAAGLGPRGVAAARTGLARSLYSVTVLADGDLVAMGRIVGDGGCFVQLVDIAVHPSRQGKGLGQDVTARLVAWCEANLPPECHLSLVSSERAVPLYAAHGFRPCRGLDRLADPNRAAPT
ncbi:GNAT family N-acetyltransferase [Jannaschia donghaensis]|uniref:Putative acetyltransferase n=1 Tax=Jannaschia donghaensis TaxID=420998 RepID=A0A0M6YDN8_9RHOB|nr:GNAT family N-acetyltransferase [Jannaschia donghaensis]CTQ48461.1 putative acetyltransferase [Jannaschia donghaensis]